MAGPADVNGDGIPDVIVGAIGADNTLSGSGSAYVVYGGRVDTPVQLATLGGGRHSHRRRRSQRPRGLLPYPAGETSTATRGPT